MPSTSAGCRRAGRGQSLVELALALPFLLLLLLGTIDIGRAFFDYIQLRNAAYEGARYGARFPNDSSGMQSRVTQHGVPSSTNFSSTVSPSGCCSVGQTGTVTVTLTHTFSPISTSFLSSVWGIGSFSMTVSASARVIT